jgi:hypothetical protein
MEAIDWFERQRWEPERARANALRFSERRFHTEMLEEIKAGIAARSRKFASGPAGSQRVDPRTKQVPSFNE